MMKEAFTTCAISYCPLTNISTGLLGIHRGKGAQGADAIIAELKQLAAEAASPMLLPIMLQKVWARVYRDEHVFVANQLRPFLARAGLEQQQPGLSLHTRS